MGTIEHEKQKEAKQKKPWVKPELKVIGTAEDMTKAAKECGTGDYRCGRP